MRELLERESTTVDLARGDFERLLRRRDRKWRNQRIVAGALAIVVVLVGFLALVRAYRSAERPADGSHPGTFTGMVIRHTATSHRGGEQVPGDLVARDPSTGGAITLVEALPFVDADKAPDFRGRLIAWAAASADGRWVAFESSFCQDGDTDWEGKNGLWVTNGTDEPRQLTAPCVEDPDGPTSQGLWAWSPTGSRLGVVEGERLILIDPATGDRTDLGQASGDVTSLAWSPDGTQIAYATVPSGSPNGNSPDGSVYAVSVYGGEHALIAESLGQVPGGEQGAGIRWSPDGTRIAVLADAGTPTLYVMNADGSDRQALAESVLVAHTGSPNITWSPDGTRIAYATLSRDDKMRIWNGSPDGSTSVLVFVPTSPPEYDSPTGGGPIWSPDGTQIAFYDPHFFHRSWMVANADGTRDIHEIDKLQYLRWRGGWYFCGCTG